MALPVKYLKINLNSQDYENYLPKKGLSGVENTALMAVCRKSIAECGTLNGCANA